MSGEACDSDVFQLHLVHMAFFGGALLWWEDYVCYHFVRTWDYLNCFWKLMLMLLKSVLWLE
eukprot:c37061_g1_i1 orf=2-184(-)